MKTNNVQLARGKKKESRWDEEACGASASRHHRMITIVQQHSLKATKAPTSQNKTEKRHSKGSAATSERPWQMGGCWESWSFLFHIMDQASNYCIINHLELKLESSKPAININRTLLFSKHVKEYPSAGLLLWHVACTSLTPPRPSLSNTSRWSCLNSFNYQSIWGDYFRL